MNENIYEQYNLVCCYCKETYDTKIYKYGKPHEGRHDLFKTTQYDSHGICKTCYPIVLKDNGLEHLIGKIQKNRKL